MDAVTATDFARHLSDFLNRVRYQEEAFVVERNRQPVAVVTPPGTPPGEVLDLFLAPQHDEAAAPETDAQPAATLSEIASRLAGLGWPDDEFAADMLWSRERRSRA